MIKIACDMPDARYANLWDSIVVEPQSKTVCFARRHSASACVLSCHSKRLPSTDSLFSMARPGLGRRLWPVA